MVDGPQAQRQGPGHERSPAVTAVAALKRAINPIGDQSRSRRIFRVVSWIVVAALVLFALGAAGVDVSGWISGLWDALRSVSAGYLVAAVVLQTLQAAFMALAWMFILRAGYSYADIRFPPIFAAYSVGVALNALLPANLGSLVMLFMFVAIIPGGTISGMLAAFVVQKIFFTVMGVLVYVYLFASVPGSFSVELGGLRRHPMLVAIIAVGGSLLIVLVVRAFREKLRNLWAQAKHGGAILGSPRRYIVEVVLPSLVGYVGKLAVIGVMLAAFAIPVTFNSVMHVVGGGSIANVTAATPGGAGVNQAITVVALRDYTDAQTAAAYSVAQQLITTSWNVVLALILVVSVFGWTNGTALLKSSYTRAERRESSKERGADAAPSTPAEPGVG